MREGFQGHSVGTGRSVTLEPPEKKRHVLQSYPPEEWQTDHLSASSHASLSQECPGGIQPSIVSSYA